MRKSIIKERKRKGMRSEETLEATRDVWRMGGEVFALRELRKFLET
jgi:hypothetical protein